MQRDLYTIRRLSFTGRLFSAIVLYVYVQLSTSMIVYTLGTYRCHLTAEFAIGCGIISTGHNHMTIAIVEYGIY